VLSIPPCPISVTVVGSTVVANMLNVPAGTKMVLPPAVYASKTPAEALANVQPALQELVGVKVIVPLAAPETAVPPVIRTFCAPPEQVGIYSQCCVSVPFMPGGTGVSVTVAGVDAVNVPDGDCVAKLYRAAFADTGLTHLTPPVAVRSLVSCWVNVPAGVIPTAPELVPDISPPLAIAETSAPSPPCAREICDKH
jgi:hypothetical protein